MATCESVIRHGKMFGVVTAVAYFAICIWYPGLRELWWLKLPAAVAFGAALGALMEWQLNDGLEFKFVIEEVEDDFKLKIPQSDWAQIVTIGNLLDHVCAHLRRSDSNSTIEAADFNTEVWERLKTVLIKQVGLNPTHVFKETRFGPEIGIDEPPRANG